MTDLQKKAIDAVLCILSEGRMTQEEAFTLIEGIFDEKPNIQYIPFTTEPYQPFNPIIYSTTCHTNQNGKVE